MSEPRVERAAEWVYRGVWKILSDWFRVPEHPPTLPVREGEFAAQLPPVAALSLLPQALLWVALIAIDVAI